LSHAPARAFDLFGLFGGEQQATPNADSVAYEIKFLGVDDNAGVAQNLKDVSNSWRLRLESPSSGAGLARRVVADFPKLAEALWANGYYDADVRARVADVAVFPDGKGAEAAGVAAERHKGQSLAPVVFDVTLGPQFHLRNVEVIDARTHAPIDRSQFSRRAFLFEKVEPAVASGIMARESAWVDELRAKSHPLAKVVETRSVVRHESDVVDVVVTLDPGPIGKIGDVRVQAPPEIPEEVIRSFIYLEKTEDYSPKRLAETRKSVSQIEAVGGVKVEDAQDRLDPDGAMPIDVITTARKEHAVGANASYSNTDGPALRAYWLDRNLFGGAERLRFDLEGGLAPTGGATAAPNLSNIQFNDVIGRAAVSFVKPALEGSRNDLLLDAAAVRERTVFYWANYANASAAIRHRFSETASVQGGVEVEYGHTFDVWGAHDYSLLGFPIAATYDSTDTALSPTKGVRAFARVTPYVAALPHGVAMVQSKAQVSGYYALDEDAWYILAGRVAAGSIVGANIEDIPASHRFFAGGGGSVRGYLYRSIAPDNGFGFPTGGRSLLETSAEARIKVTQNVGVVPFVDAGTAYAAPYPDFDTTLRAAAGIGLRYYTAIGPIRFDVAAPLNRRPGDGKFAIFIGIGESF
jgi:translocation and assembly module TamA